MHDLHHPITQFNWTPWITGYDTKYRHSSTYLSALFVAYGWCHSKKYILFFFQYLTIRLIYISGFNVSKSIHPYIHCLSGILFPSAELTKVNYLVHSQYTTLVIKTHQQRVLLACGNWHSDVSFDSNNIEWKLPLWWWYWRENFYLSFGYFLVNYMNNYIFYNCPLSLCKMCSVRLRL